MDAATAQDIIAAYHSGELASEPFPANDLSSSCSAGLEIARTKADCLELLVKPAFEKAFEASGDLDELLQRVEFADLSPDDYVQPHTVDRGPEAPTLVAMDWRGTPDDVICLAHEVAHALQILLSAHETMPPLARETFAFLGELLLIEHTRIAAPDLYGMLCDVWCSENAAYLGGDLDALAAALADPQMPYHYRQNYPIARLAAVQLFRRPKGAWLHDLAASGRNGIRHLPLEVMANRAGEIANYLPPFPQPDTERPAIDAYRSLGAMALLDIDYWRGESEKRIEDYYAGLLAHLHEKTAFLALDADRKPMGYATWTPPEEAGSVTLTRQAAPFGDHLLLQQMLERHLGHSGAVSARHTRSARQEQVAW
ncbi:hypothetical protein [Pelagibacterium halotolerans]|uniref:hypothetical protein n=1 Tax=Pelagibacterium halotolerans TaxID=531813 RepID=UPI00384CAF66